MLHKWKILHLNQNFPRVIIRTKRSRGSHENPAMNNGVPLVWMSAWSFYRGSSRRRSFAERCDVVPVRVVSVRGTSRFFSFFL